MANIKFNVRTRCERVKVEVNDGSQISKARSLKRWDKVIRCDDITDDPLSQLVRAIFPCRWTDSLNQWWIVIQYIYEYIWFLWVTWTNTACVVADQYSVTVSCCQQQLSRWVQCWKESRWPHFVHCYQAACLFLYDKAFWCLVHLHSYTEWTGKKNSTLSNRSQLERCNIIKKD